MTREPHPTASVAHLLEMGSSSLPVPPEGGDPSQITCFLWGGGEVGAETVRSEGFGSLWQGQATGSCSGLLGGPQGM